MTKPTPVGMSESHSESSVNLFYRGEDSFVLEVIRDTKVSDIHLTMEDIEKIYETATKFSGTQTREEYYEDLSKVPNTFDFTSEDTEEAP